MAGFKKVVLFFFLAALLLIVGCGTPDPVKNLAKLIPSDTAEWSIILEDMRVKGLFSVKFFHKYKLITGNGDTTEQAMVEKVTDWQQVSRRHYENYKPYYHMVLASKLPGQAPSYYPTPPGYQYVGDTRYGQWRQDSYGHSFWEFYGKYAMFQTLLSGFRGSRNIYQDDYRQYRRYREYGRPYSGSYSQHQQRTAPSRTQNSFDRRRTGMAQRQSAFQQKARSRMGRTSRGSYSRSSGRGK